MLDTPAPSLRLRHLCHGLIASALLGLTACAQEPAETAEAPAAEAAPPAAERLFASGFEPGTQANSATDLTDLSGTDQSTGYDWEDDLDDGPGLGAYFVEYTGGTPEQRWARLIPEPGNPENHVLWFSVSEANASNGNGRVQASLYGNRDLKAFTFSNRLYLHEDLQKLQEAEAGFKFFTLFEFWNDPNWTGTEPHYPFRVSVNMGKDAGAGAPFYLHVDAQTDVTGKSRWRDEWGHRSDYVIPVGQWLTVELYIEEGDADHGRFKLAITPEGGTRTVLFDLTELTHHPEDPEPDGISHWNPQKLYTSAQTVARVREAGGATQLYWDDFKFWRGDAFGTAADRDAE